MSDRKPKKQTGFSKTDLAELSRVSFDPVITRQEVEDYEKTQNETWGTKRRLTLMTLSRTRKELLEGFCKTDDDPEVVFELIGHINEWKSHCETNAEFASVAAARLMAVTATMVQADPQKKTPAAKPG